MNKQKSLRIVNLLIAALILLLAGTAVFNETIPYTIYSKIHPLTGYLLSFFVLLHVTLNFGWIKSNYLKRETEKRNFGYAFHYYGIDHEEVNDDLS